MPAQVLVNCVTGYGDQVSLKLTEWLRYKKHWLCRQMLRCISLLYIFRYSTNLFTLPHAIIGLYKKYKSAKVARIAGNETRQLSNSEKLAGLVWNVIRIIYFQVEPRNAINCSIATDATLAGRLAAVLHLNK